MEEAIPLLFLLTIFAATIAFWLVSFIEVEFFRLIANIIVILAIIACIERIFNL